MEIIQQNQENSLKKRALGGGELDKEIEIIKINQKEILELKNSVNEMQTETENMNGRMDQAEEKNT